MTTLDHDIQALCRAIDAGDDGVLPILADALEEAGDSRGAGLRYAVLLGKRPRWKLANWGWWASNRRGGDLGSRIAWRVANRLPSRWAGVTVPGYASYNYRTRSAAFLALAAALAPERSHA